ncbi:L-threonine aldolase [Hasllibacter halocynthiae]|uniref:L-threonine aldolase n=1 Tax=Hasllibacter halocynthiae TaxID=595589 RepID=A0A2T0X0X2_9RHOB|nr:beta-eliminating lyase-related protein [Hasllibacter halocynthiae]PRY92603.1 L-threonine aldolase [Hasllibacter halocynthiae]
MNFASDNTGPVHPKVWEALRAADEGHAGAYGAELEMEAVGERLRELLGWPDASVRLVATGTAGNSLALACLAKPWSAIFCSEDAHVHKDECNAPEFFTGGAKLTLVPSPDGRMAPGDLAAAIAREEARGVHGPQRGPVTVTQATELGTVHSLDHLAALRGAAGKLPLHMDGARFANALVSLGCGPDEMVRDFDAVTFGATKNGAMGVEAVVFQDPSHDWEFQLRRKRGAHLFSKHRYLSAQMAGYLDVWERNARHANAMATALVDGLQGKGIEIAHAVEANLLFPRLPAGEVLRLWDAGVRFYPWEGEPSEDRPEETVLCRMVCGWTTTEEEIEGLLGLL